MNEVILTSQAAWEIYYSLCYDHQDRTAFGFLAMSFWDGPDPSQSPWGNDDERKRAVVVFRLLANALEGKND